MLWRSRLGLLLTVVMLSGCEALDAFTFNKDTRSGVPGDSETWLTLIDRFTDLRSPSVLSQGAGFPGLSEAMTQCQVVSHPTGPVPAIPPLLIPLAGLAVDTGTRVVSEAIQAKVDALKQASMKGYSGVLILDDARSFGLGQTGSVAQCLLLVRRIKQQSGEFEPASALLLGIIPRGVSAHKNAAAAVFSPLFVQVERSAAVTRSGKPISMAVALSVVAIVTGKAGAERREISLGAFQINNLDLGVTRAWKSPTNAGTGLMVLPPSQASALELKVAVVETGSALPDFDKAKAEIQAVRDAVGPELKGNILKVLPTE